MLLFISQEERTTEGWTAGVVDSWEYNGRGQQEEHEEWTARRTTGGEDSHKGGY